MNVLGNSQDAKLIYQWVHGQRDKRDPYAYSRGSMGAPEGWEFLGYGSFRSAWRSPEGVCYKVEHYYSGWANDSDNSKEYKNWSRWSRECILPERVRLPDLTYFENGGKPVIAMECVKGVTLTAWRRRPGNEGGYEAYRKLMFKAEDEMDGMCDMHGENVMVEEETGDLVVVDLQM